MIRARMLARRTTRSACMVLGLLPGCVERPTLGGTTGDDGETTTGGATTGAPTTTGAGLATDSTDDAPGTGTTSASASSDESTAVDTCSFLCEPEDDGSCDVFKQDCEDGEKCAPWASQDGDVWNATKCVPVTGDGKPGEPCTAEGGGVSGFDDCSKGSFCWDVDHENHGTCIELCSGSADEPVCEDGTNFSCITFDVEVVHICVATCDPLKLDCPGDGVCDPVGNIFRCFPDKTAEDLKALEACDEFDDRAEGLICLSSEPAMECGRPGYCCTPSCDVTGPNVACPGVGQECVPYFPDDTVPKYAHVGICLLP